MKESELMEDMEKAREKARRWEQVHVELMKLPKCHRHGTVGFSSSGAFLLFLSVIVHQADFRSLFFYSLGA